MAMFRVGVCARWAAKTAKTAAHTAQCAVGDTAIEMAGKSGGDYSICAGGSDRWISKRRSTWR